MDWIPIQGNSMMPFLQPDDQVALSWQQTACIGDIILIRAQDGSLILHRALQTFNEKHPSVFIKGDRGHVIEQYSGSQVLGKVVAVKRIIKGSEIQKNFHAVFLDQCIAFCSRHGFRKLTWIMGYIHRWI